MVSREEKKPHKRWTAAAALHLSPGRAVLREAVPGKRIDTGNYWDVQRAGSLQLSSHQHTALRHRLHRATAPELAATALARAG